MRFGFNAGHLDFSKEPTATFDPRDRAHRRKLWVRVAARDHHYYHVYWRRVTVAALALGVAAWLGLAGLAWGYLKYRRGYDGVRYLDLAFYPWRRTQHQIGLGHHYIAAGRSAWEAQNYREAYAFLLAGIARVPDDLTARRYIAITEARIGRPERALKTLIAGVDHARRDLDYMKLLFGMLLEAQEDDRVIELARELLPAVPDAQIVNQFIALQCATAHFHRGRAGEVERIIADWRLQKSLEAQLLLARCEWQRGQRELALARLERAVPEFRKRDELYVELVKLNRELGRYAESRRYALLRQFNNPGSAGARIDVIHTYHLAGDTAAEQRELAAFLTSFRKDQPGLILLAWLAVDTAQPALAEQAYALAQENKFPLPVFELARAQTLIAARAYTQALALIDTASRPSAGGSEQINALLGGLRALALYGSGDPARAQIALNAFLEGPRIRANDLLLLARQLKALGQPGPARRVIARACELDRRNEPALAELVRMDGEAGDRVALAENLPRLLALRQHHRAALEATLATLTEPADAPLRRQIEDALRRTEPR